MRLCTYRGVCAYMRAIFAMILPDREVLANILRDELRDVRCPEVGLGISFLCATLLMSVLCPFCTLSQNVYLGFPSACDFSLPGLGLLISKSAAVHYLVCDFSLPSLSRSSALSWSFYGRVLAALPKQLSVRMITFGAITFGACRVRASTVRRANSGDIWRA